MGRLLFALTALLLCSQLSAQESAGRNFAGLLFKRDYAAATKAFDSKMSAAMTPDALRRMWESLEAQAGPFKGELGARKERGGGYDIIVVTCQFEMACLDLRATVDKDGRICGLFFRPSPYVMPPYVDAGAFKDSDMTVGSGEWALPGTLSLPNGAGPFPGVVLVHGSGPNDRDETVMACKPVRDLAWGLASKGIAVLRYEKRTRQHAAKLSKGITVKEESVDDALEAVAVLRKNPSVDAKRVFVIGHSLGGTLIPRIGLRDGSLAGFIVMAGAARPLEDLIFEQTLYVSSKENGGSGLAEKELEQLKEQIALVKSLALSNEMMALGIPGSYWLDLRGYEPAKEAAKLGRPMLILQGGRDYQVTMEDFRIWSESLSNDKSVSLKAYPALNHLFIAGEGKLLPSEYGKAGHVDGAVIEDISSWLKAFPR